MGTRFVAARGLDTKVAVMVAPEIGDLADRVERAAKAFAPPVKEWHTVGDAKVRPWHKSAPRLNDGGVPENLRFKLEHSPRTYRNYHPPGYELLREPRDPSAHWTQTRDCRCMMTFNDALARSIKAGPAIVTGATVRAVVSTDFPRAAESEFGNDVDHGAHFMRRAISLVAAES